MFHPSLDFSRFWEMSTPTQKCSAIICISKTQVALSIHSDPSAVADGTALRLVEAPAVAGGDCHPTRHYVLCPSSLQPPNLLTQPTQLSFTPKNRLVLLMEGAFQKVTSFHVLLLPSPFTGAKSKRCLDALVLGIGLNKIHLRLRLGNGLSPSPSSPQASCS